MIDVLALPRLNRQLFNDLCHEVGNLHRTVFWKIPGSFLLKDLDSEPSFERIVCLNDRADPVLQLWNDLSAAVIG